MRSSSRPLSFALALAIAASVAGSASCSGGSSGPAPGSDLYAPPDASTDAGEAPFTAVAPATYVAKVKNLLVGLPPTDAEVKAVEADPTQLRTLVDGWMKLPQYEQKMQNFFEQAFQQGQISIDDFAIQVSPRTAGINGFTPPILTQNVEESFARTAVALVQSGHSFTETLTTTSFMMTPALMEFYAFLDGRQVDDNGTVVDWFRATYPNQQVTASLSAGPVPIEQTVDPTSPNFMHWYNIDVGSTKLPDGCRQDPILFQNADSVVIHYMLMGSLDNYLPCRFFGGTKNATQFAPTDFTAWKMVNIRKPNPGESITRFFDLPLLRTTNELVLNMPRIGFFSTPAFFANWKTNASNQMRATVNQTLIVALGAQVDGTDPTSPKSTPGLDATHGQSAAACFGCHQLLDPTRSIFSANYSWFGHKQDDTLLSAEHGQFAFEGVIRPVASMSDFANVLAYHPLFSYAWVQKLSYYANSRPTDTTDPEFQRIMGLFISSGYQWNVLVRELFSSPLTTGATRTQTVANGGEVVSIMRANHFCTAMSFRLGINDVCGLDATNATAQATTIPTIVSGLPTDAYGRGTVAPVLPNSPTLFFRSGIENICQDIAQQVIDPATPIAGQKSWSSASPTPAIADFVAQIMALPPSDARSAPSLEVLNDHFTSAMASGETASDALKSTFVVACLAPSAVSVGL